MTLTSRTWTIRYVTTKTAAGSGAMKTFLIFIIVPSPCPCPTRSMLSMLCSARLLSLLVCLLACLIAMLALLACFACLFAFELLASY